MLRAALTLIGHAIGGRQHDRYVLREMRRRLNGGRHSVLGNDVKDESATRREAADFLGALQCFGLKNTDRCIEIGCGSLWAAEPVIEFLQPDSYLGLDVTDLFYSAGRKRLPPALLSEKRPAFALISVDSLASACMFRPNFIFSRKTLVHVPPSELGPFFRQACAMMNPGATCVHESPAPRIRSDQYNKYSWRHSFSDVQSAIPPGFQLEYCAGSYLVRAVD